MRMLVLGAGGIGGYAGGHLAASGADITFLVRPRRRDQLEADGLRILSPLGNVQLQVKTVTASDVGAGYDFVLLTCKAYDLDSAIDAIAPAVDSHCAVVPMLNGMAHLEVLSERFGGDSVMGGTCLIDVSLARTEPFTTPAFCSASSLASETVPVSPRARSLAAALANTPMESELSENVLLSMWEKMVFLSVLAAATCLFRANVREIVASPGGREVMNRALDANIEIAQLEGYPPRDDVMERARSRLTDPEGMWSASMLRDLEGGGQVEADHVVGWMLAKARTHDVDDTFLSLAYTHLKAYEARRAAGRLPGRG